MTLSKFVVPEIVFGNGARRLIGQYTHNLGAARVLLVSDPGVVAAGWADDVRSRIEAEAIRVVTFSAVSQNPRASEMMNGAGVYLAEHCDIIAAVGGGSALDCAKGIGIVVAHGQDVLEFEGVDRIRQPSPPLICVPTTAGSSADVSQFVIVLDPVTRAKKAIISKALVPDVALIDPETTVTMDPYVTACTGIDALSHGIEAYVSTTHSPVVDLYALDAVRTVSRHLVAALERPEDLDARLQMMLASLKAGMAFSNVSLGAAHAMAHAVGGMLDLAHGECIAMLLPTVVACNYAAAPKRFDDLGGALGLRIDAIAGPARCGAIVEYLAELCTAAGFRRRLGGCGVQAGQLAGLARLAARDACVVTNPRRLSVDELEAVYGEAL